MSVWRREALKRLPEFQKIIASREVDNQMMLWILLQSAFDKLCEQEEPDLDLLTRVWRYAKWCMVYGHPDVRTAAAIGFCEDLIDTKSAMRLLPKIMSRDEYIELKNLLLYHNSIEKFERGLEMFDPGYR